MHIPEYFRDDNSVTGDHYQYILAVKIENSQYFVPVDRQALCILPLLYFFVLIGLKVDVQLSQIIGCVELEEVYNHRWHSGKESACQCRRCKRRGFNRWVRKIPWSRKWQPTPIFLPGKFHGKRSLASYNPWDHKESDMTEHTHT